MAAGGRGGPPSKNGEAWLPAIGLENSLKIIIRFGEPRNRQSSCKAR